MNRQRLLALVSVVAFGCSPTAEIDEEETLENIAGVLPPQVLFDPGGSVIPVPNTLLIDPATGRLNLPVNETCDDATTQAFTQLYFNTLNGWSTNTPEGPVPTVFPIDIPLSESVDVNSVADSVRMFNLVTGAPVAFVPLAATVPVLNEQCNQIAESPVLRLLPGRLEEGAAYGLLIEDGLLTSGGDAFTPSVTWALVRPEVNPVEIEITEDGDAVTDTGIRFNVTRNETPFDPTIPEEAGSIVGIDGLWKYHNEPLIPGAPGFLTVVELLQSAQGRTVTRSDILHAFFFQVQDSGSSMDGSVETSVTASFTPSAPSRVAPFTGPDDMALTPTEFLTGAGIPCDQLPCDQVGQALVLEFEGTNFLQLVDGVPTAFADPYAFSDTGEAFTLTAWYFEPAGDAPEGGWPVAIFGHGITRSKSDMLALVPQMNAAGIAVVGIDWPLHGAPSEGGRAVLNPCFQPEPPASCDNPVVIEACAAEEMPDPTIFPDEETEETTEIENGDCYVPYLDLGGLEDVAALRDRPRQAVFDVQSLINTLKFCADNECVGDFGTSYVPNPDPERIGYIGQSLGGIIGALITPNIPDIKASVLNVAGVDYVTTILFSEELQCEVVGEDADEGLKALGVVPAGADCTDPSDYASDEGFLSFAAGVRWVWESGDGQTFIGDLADGSGPAVLVQEVDGDTVVSNESTAILGGLLGQTAVVANTDSLPSAGVTGENAQSILWLDYVSDGVNEYDHGSLLSPAEEVDVNAARLGLQQMQTDAITFLVTHLAPATTP